MGRGHSKIHHLPPEVKQAVERMAADPRVRYKDIVNFLTGQGFKVSESTVGSFARRFNANRAAQMIVHENARALLEDRKLYPDLDPTEALIMILSDKTLSSLVSMTQEEIDSLPPKDKISFANNVIKAAAVKKRVDVQNKNIQDAGLDEVKGMFFDTMSQNNPALYERVVAYIESLKEKDADGGEGC